MAEVFLAERIGAEGIRRQVVLKCLLDWCAEDPKLREAFQREARISVHLSHGNIAQVFDVGEHEGRLFLAMEYVAGKDLKAILRRLRSLGRRMPAAVAVRILQEVARGLAYAHELAGEDGRPLGIIHRDVSPDNIMVAWDGQVKILDFGIATTALHRGATNPGDLKGKYRYLAPEQLRRAHVDARTDIYAAGVVLYEALAGRPPFEGEMLEVFGAIAESRYPPLSELCPDLDPALVATVERAMARDPEARHQSARELEADLGAYLARSGSETPPLARFLQALFEEGDGRVRPGEAVPDAAGHRPGTRGLAVALAGGAALLGLAAGGLLFALGSPSPRTVVHSVPPGALLTVEGRALGRTPVELTTLEAGRPYEAELSLAGHRPRRFILVGGTRHEARLVPETPVRPLATPEAEPEEAPEGPISTKMRAIAFEPTDVPGVRAVDLPLELLPWRNVGVRKRCASLNPRRAHRITVRGGYHLYMHVTRPKATAAIYTATGPRKRDLGVVARERPVRLEEGFTEICLMLAEAALPVDNTGTLTFFIRDGSGRTKRVRLDAQLAIHAPPVVAVTEVPGLRPDHRWALRLEAKGGRWAPGGRQVVLVRQRTGLDLWEERLGGPDSYIQALRPGEEIVVEYTDAVDVFLVDENPGDNEGQWRLVARDLGPSPRPLPRRRSLHLELGGQ